MRQYVLSILALFFVPSFVFSQSHLMVEMDKLPAINRERQLQFIPLKSLLKCDFLRNRGNSAIGISDVGVDSATAYQQAYLRALSIMALGNAKAKGMSDFYNDEKGAQKSSNYEELCQIKANLNLPIAALKIIDSQWLASGELILFLNIDSTSQKLDDRLTVNCLATIYYKENQDDGGRQIINRIMLENETLDLNKANIHSEISTYSLGDNRWTGKEVFFDSVKIKNDQYKLFYEFEDVCTTDMEDVGSNTIDGLWTAFVGSIYRQLSGQLKVHFLKIKNVGEVYDNKITSLNRETGFVPFGCKIIEGALLDNKLRTQIEIITK